MMEERELVSLVEQEFNSAMGAPDGDISSERADAWDYYLSKEMGNEIEGQSQVRTSDVSDVVDGMMPSLLRIFTISENLVDFDPVGEEDIPKAQQESDYVNHVFFKKNPAFLILYTWFFDALVQKNGIVKAWWDDSEIVTTESYRGLNEQELAELMDDDELEPVEREERTETVTQEIVTPQGVVEQDIEVKLTDIKFKRTTKSGRARVVNVPPEEYRISADSRSLDPCDARMVGHEREVPRSELIEMGFDKDIVEDLPATTSDHSEEELSRRDKFDEDDSPIDKSQEMIEVKEAYIKVDFDEDGSSELRQVIVAGGELLSNEEVDRQPFHVISPQPLPHKHFGRATADKVMDVQQVTTTLTRQVLDNLYQTNNPSHAVWEQGIGENTLDDLLTTQAGSIKRFRRPVSESWQPMSIPFTASGTFPMLEFYDKIKRDRTGVASDGEGLNPEQLKNIQSSVLAQASDLSRMKIEAVVRIFAETGIKSLFLHLHELLLKHQKKEDIVLLRNQFVSVNPQEWRTRSDMTVKIGLGVGTREQNLLHLENIWQKQKDIVSAGGLGTLVTPDNLFNTAAELVKNANLKQPEMFFKNPQGQPLPQQDDPGAAIQQAQIELAQRQQELEAREQEFDRERDMQRHQIDVARIQQSQQKIENDFFVKMEEIATKLTELEAKFATNIPGSKI